MKNNFSMHDTSQEGAEQIYMFFLYLIMMTKKKTYFHSDLKIIVIAGSSDQ